MTTNDTVIEIGLLSFEVCMKEVPIDEATNPETADYIVFFCGLECFEQWVSQDARLAMKGVNSGL